MILIQNHLIGNFSTVIGSAVFIPSERFRQSSVRYKVRVYVTEPYHHKLLWCDLNHSKSRPNIDVLMKE